MVAVAVFGLLFLLDRTGTLPGSRERIIEVTLGTELPGLRSRLRPGAVSADGLTVRLAGSAAREDSAEVMEGFRKLVTELGADPSVITAYGPLPPARVAQEDLVRRWLPWFGVAAAVGVLCQLWLWIGTLSRSLARAEPGEAVTKETAARPTDAGKQGVEPGPDARPETVGTSPTVLAAPVDWVEDRIRGSKAAFVRLGRMVGKQRRAIANQDVKMEELSAALKVVTDWKEKIGPHIEALGLEATQRSKLREGSRALAEETVRVVEQEKVKPLPTEEQFQWDAGWRELARQMGVRNWVRDKGQESAMRAFVTRVARGPESSFMMVAPPKVGKGAFLKALPVFFGYAPAGAERIMKAGPSWNADTVMGFDGYTYHPGILPEAIMEAIKDPSPRKCPWVMIDELGKLPREFGEVFSGFIESLFALGQEERRVQIFHAEGSKITVALPEAFRLIMARNPSLTGFTDHAEFDGDGAWTTRIAVMHIPPLDAPSEETILRGWIDWSGRSDGQRDPGEFSGAWKRLPHAIPPGPWLGHFCRVLQASRKSHNGHQDPGWKYIETGTGITRSLIWDAAQGGVEGFQKRLADGLYSQVVQEVSNRVSNRKELSIFREVLREEEFEGLASRMT